jgi:hypothetical protein
MGATVVTLMPGQFITGRHAACRELNVTPQVFRSRIRTLTKTARITIKSTNKYSVITVVNWAFYQSREDKITNKQPTNNQQITTDNNVNKENNPSEQSSQGLPAVKKDDMSGFNKVGDDYEEGYVDIDGSTSLVGEKKKKPSKNYPKVYAVFARYMNVPLNWTVNKTQQAAAENLYTERGIEKIERALQFHKEHKDIEYCPVITSPYDLDSKWSKLLAFKKKYGEE